jgi:hypothetical protein
MPISTHSREKFFTLFTDFFLFWAPKIHFRIGRHENKEKCRFCFGLSILLKIKIHLLKIVNKKIKKIDVPSYLCTVYELLNL